MQVEEKQIEDSISKVNNEIAVGSDLDFQEKWWRFEKGIWVLFTMIVIAALLGLLGRGPLAKSHIRAQDGSLDLQYDRVERYSTPSIVVVQFGNAAIRDGAVQLWAAGNLIKDLGNKTIVPQPVKSMLINGGTLYTFAAGTDPGSVQFVLEPPTPGPKKLRFQVPGFQEIQTAVLVLP